MDNKEIRRRNLLWLKSQKEKSLGKKNATWAKLAESWHTDAQYLMQIKSDKTEADMGDKIARSIEKAERKPKGWMDAIQFSGETKTQIAKIEFRSDLSDTEKRILALWRGWSPIVKQYVFGQMLVADYTKDVLVDMFKIEKRKPPTESDFDAMVLRATTSAGLIKSIKGRKK